MNVINNDITLSIKLSGIRVIKYEEDSRGDLMLYVETTEVGVNCRCFGKPITNFHGTDREVKLHHLSVFENELYIIYKPHRYLCDDCDTYPTTTTTPEWHKPNSSYIDRFERRILLELVNSTVAEVSTKNNLTEKSVLGILDRQINATVNWSLINYSGIMGIDEIALKKGYKDYVTVITSRVNNEIKLLAVLNGRKRSMIKAFFKNILTHLKNTVDAICTDMYEGYVQAAREV